MATSNSCRKNQPHRPCVAPVAAAVTVLVAVLYADPSPAAAQQVDTPEAARFDAAEFHNGLKKRGLTDLLALHLAEHPPADVVNGTLLNREIRLAEFADPSRSLPERREAIADANRLLESLIDANPGDRRIRAWQMELVTSLLYVEAERYTTGILYRGGSESDRKALHPLMERAVRVSVGLYEELFKEYQALDAMPARQYDRLEATGLIEELESDLAQSDYMLAWARYYRSLSRATDELDRVDELEAVLEYLRNRSNLLLTPHSETHFQAQALLLTGMTYRQLNQYRSARKVLEQAIEVAANILNDSERRELAWVVTLGRIELVRSHGDAEDFTAAHHELATFRQELRRFAPADFGRSLILALLERTIFRAQAERAEAGQRSGQAKELRNRSVQGLRILANRDPVYRDEIYATLYEVLGENANLTDLQPFERCALLAGALGRAGSLGEELRDLRVRGLQANDEAVTHTELQRAATLDRAVAIAKSVTESDRPVAPELAAEAAFNLGAALHQRGRRLEAAESFLSVAREHPQFFRAKDAATYAVQLAWELHQDPSLASRPDVRALYVDALTTLTESFPKSTAGRYWQFFFAQHLLSLQRFDEAAEAYDKVQSDHERFHESNYLAFESRAYSLKQFDAAEPEQLDAINRRSPGALFAARRAERTLSEAVQAEADPTRRAGLRRLAAQTTVLTGEVHALPGVARWTKALETLDGFENRFPEQPALIGRVLRVRMIALEALGRHDEASSLIPQYVANDPQGAAPTLQGLFDALREEIQRDKRAGREERARARARSAVLIAEGIYNLARRQPDVFRSDAVYALRLQLAESAIETRDFARAAELFEQCLAQDAARATDSNTQDRRALLGTAEAYFGLDRHEEALPLYNRIFRATKRNQPVFWKALLRDLQCRTALEHDPAQIIKSIRQQKFLDHEMGGPDLRRQFDTLLTTNEQRAADRS